MKRAVFACLAVAALALLVAATASAARRVWPGCYYDPIGCTEKIHNITDEGQYTGHDEPSVLFYSSTPGSGNNQDYRLRLPRDAANTPQPNGGGGVWNFQLHPAFWFGMAMCDNQSAPEFTHAPCHADTDANIANSPDPNSPQYIGRHVGTAFMEMQFYPPGWASLPAGVSCSATKWCSALTIDSLLFDDNNKIDANPACVAALGSDEPQNFAFITKSGVAQAPAGPLDNGVNTPQLGRTPKPSVDLMMNPGDLLDVSLHDSPAGFRVVVRDLTTGQTGSMTASTANGFAQVMFTPRAATCKERPYAFHPMYSTSTPNTNVEWAAHTYNVAFSDEIGHFENCSQADAQGNCTQPVRDAKDDDNTVCFNPSDSLLVPIGGCVQTDDDFDGTPYHAGAWPGQGGTTANQSEPITFSSPTFNGGRDYTKTAFETDLPLLEFAFGFSCDISTGLSCFNPPPNAGGYPMFSTATGGRDIGLCQWEEGGPNIPGTTQNFGGSPEQEYGATFRQLFPGFGFRPAYGYFNFQRRLDFNPCPVNG